MHFDRSLAPLPLRLMLAIGFLYHGLPKLFSAQEHDMVVGMFTQIGIPAPGLMVWVVGIIEVLGALALLAGAGIRIATVLLAGVMLVALVTVHLPNGFNFINITGMGPNGMPMFGMPGYEVNLLYLAGLASLFLGGPGRWSWDERHLSHEASVRGESMRDPVAGA